MAGLRPSSKQTKSRLPKTHRREVGGAIQPKSKAISTDQSVACDIPAKLSPTKAEVALWRAFMPDEIDAILRDGE
jgi:hypothetical protein